jgi:hypothetical protein
MPESIFVEGNVIEGEPQVDRDNWRGMGYYYLDRDSLKAVAPFPAPPVTTEPARAAYERVLEAAGDYRALARRCGSARPARSAGRHWPHHSIQWVREAGQ